MIAHKPAHIAIKDPLTITVSNTLNVSCVKDEDNKVISLDIPNLATISVGDRISIGKTSAPYRVNTIVERQGHGLPIYDLRIAVRTKSSLFLLPMFPGPKHAYFYDKFFLNCFMGTDKEDDVLALLYRFSGIKSFIELEDALKKLTIFKRSEDPTEKTVLYVFEVPHKYKKDYQRFLKGKYSEFSERYKNRILEFHNMSKDSVIGHILYKDDARRLELEEIVGEPLPKDAELHSIPNPKYENYDPKIYSL